MLAKELCFPLPCPPDQWMAAGGRLRPESTKAGHVKRVDYKVFRNSLRCRAYGTIALAYHRMC